MWMSCSASRSLSERCARQSKVCSMQLRPPTSCTWPLVARTLFAGLLLIGAVRIAPADFLDDPDQKLSLSLFHNQVRLRLSGSFDLETYYIDQPPPGLIFTDDHFLVNPRLTLFLDTQLGPHVSTFVQARVDRGFD